MADNWAENTDGEIHDNPPNDPGPDADANVDIDNDDGTNQQRNNVENNPDEVNADEPKPPKRGRGRPRKEEDPQAALRKELEEIRKENSKLCEKLRTCVSEKDDVIKDLELTRSSLMEREHDYAELLEQFSHHEENNSPHTVCKPSGVVFYDDITESCVSTLKSSISWNKVKKGLGDIKFCESDNIKNADLALILTGADEIAAGVSAFQLHQTLKGILSDCEDTQVYIAYLPPNNNARVQIDLYNHKLNGMENENVHILKVRFLGSKLDLVGYNGSTPSSKCISLYEEVLKTISVPTNLKPKDAASGETSFDFDITSVLPIKSEMVGRIIGRNGVNIKKITSTCKVKMSFGSWKEKGNESRDEEPDSFTAVMIQGKVSNVHQAIAQIKDITKPK
jgi:hypothetical protein